MGYKVRQIDKLEKVAEGVLLRLSATVTYTDGVKDISTTVASDAVNPTNAKPTDVDASLTASLKKHISDRATKLDSEATEAASMETLKGTILNDLAQAGLTFVLLVLLMFPSFAAWAGDLTPSWEAMTSLTASSGVSLSNIKPTYIGTIDCSGYYAVEINVNWDESGNNPSGTAGVSLYAQSGTTVGAIPFIASEISATDYANNYDQTKGSSGVTKMFLIENIPYIAIGIGKTAADADTFHVRYRRMKGQY